MNFIIFDYARHYIIHNHSKKIFSGLIIFNAKLER
jgi:hypothetical protein